ncbi:hypothetical protein M513_12396 [Trichuris suis]|uniref:BHLH domain-containing protein n=1 Tax=Trichuris suis TaxID=68888 RepID=A0A085LP37_9BILA|nr:hypothetical protein M513_12396 [Trichuris suis]
MTCPRRTKPQLSRPSASAAMKARKALMRRLQKQEVRRLQSALPPEVRRRRGLNEVINEATRYIDQLHNVIVARVKAGLLPPEILRSIRHIPAHSIIETERCLPFIGQNLFAEISILKLQSRLPHSNVVRKEHRSKAAVYSSDMRLL